MLRRRPARNLAHLAAVAAIALIGCGSNPPAESEPAGQPVPMACYSLDPARCAVVVAALPEQLPAGAVPQYIAISEGFCDGPCPGFEAGDWRGHVFVEYVDGREPSNWTLEVRLDDIAWESIPTFSVRVEPASLPLAGGRLELELGHCGLWSGVDVDRSFWDPVGQVDSNHPDAINAAAALFTQTSNRTARLETENGLDLSLSRHIGAKYLPGCD